MLKLFFLVFQVAEFGGKRIDVIKPNKNLKNTEQRKISFWKSARKWLIFCFERKESDFCGDKVLTKEEGEEEKKFVKVPNKLDSFSAFVCV